MHLGQIIETELTRQRFSIAEVARQMSKSETAVRKDLKKDKLHMDVIEGYSKVLNMNFYKLLANEMESKEYRNPEHEISSIDDSPVPSIKKVKKPVENSDAISITFQVPSEKKEALIKLLTS